MLDSVTLIGYTSGTVKNCESGRSSGSSARFLWERGVARKLTLVGKALFAGRFPELEAELGGIQAGGGFQGPGRSPDRADAMVWAMTVLSETRSGVPRVRRL